MKFQKKVIILWLAVIMWMFVIFNLSSQPAPVSNNLSKTITILFINVTKQIQKIDIISLNHVGQINSIIRGYAHGFVYMILAILVVSALRGSGMNVLMSCLFTFVISVTFAYSDELHQMFVPGRGVQLQDLLMDCAGILLGLAIFNLVFLFYKITKFFIKQVAPSENEDKKIHNDS